MFRVLWQSEVEEGVKKYYARSINRFPLVITPNTSRLYLRGMPSDFHGFPLVKIFAIYREMSNACETVKHVTTFIFATCRLEFFCKNSRKIH